MGVYACGSEGQTKDLESGEKVQDQGRVRAGRGLGTTQKLWVENPPHVGGMTHPAGVRTHPRRSAVVLGSGLKTTVSCRFWVTEHAGPPCWRDDLFRPQNRPACRIAPPQLPRRRKTEAKEMDP